MAAVNKVAKKPVKAKQVFSKKNSTTMVGKLRKEYEAKDWASFTDEDRIRLHQELNHCNYEFDKSVFSDWAQAYVAKFRPAQLKSVKGASDDLYTAAIGFVAFLATKGASLNAERMNWLNSKVDYLADAGDRNIAEKAALAAKAANKPSPSTIDAVGTIMAEIEGVLDDEEGSVYELLKAMKPTASQAQAIKTRYQGLLDEMEELAKGKDKELLEGYRNHNTAAKRKELLGRVRQIFTDVDLYVNGTKAQKVTRAPRAKKALPVEKVVAGLKFAAGAPDLKIESIPVANLVGAKTAVLYNTKYKTLLVVVATEEGLSAKGASLTNVAVVKQKKLRKPEVTLPEVLAANRARLDVVFNTLTTTEAEGSARLTTDVVLLKAYR